MQEERHGQMSILISLGMHAYLHTTHTKCTVTRKWYAKKKAFILCLASENMRGVMCKCLHFSKCILTSYLLMMAIGRDTTIKEHTHSHTSCTCSNTYPHTHIIYTHTCTHAHVHTCTHAYVPLSVHTCTCNACSKKVRHSHTMS